MNGTFDAEGITYIYLNTTWFYDMYEGVLQNYEDVVHVNP